MAQNFGAVVLGVKQLQAKLVAAGEWEPNAVRTAVKTEAQIIVDEAIPLMESQFVTDPSRRDGQLEHSLRTSASASKRGISAAIIEGRVAGEQSSGMYAGIWEFGGYPRGWPYRAGGRALFPTVQKKREEFAKAITAVLQQMADNIGGP